MAIFQLIASYVAIVLLFGIFGASLIARGLKAAIMGLEVHEIAALFHERNAIIGAIPKGIDGMTLTKVRAVFDDQQVTDLNAEEVGKIVGISRSTVRRYLEFLASEGFLTADLIYGVVGRPERRYVRGN